MPLEPVATAIGHSLGVSLRPQPASRVQGGSINECYRWEGDAGPLFVKVAPARGSAMFEAEAAGLEELRRAQAVRVPRVMSVGTSAGKAWLALEWIQTAPGSRATDVALGERLARQHRSTQPAFGWSRDNTIGSTPQPNHQDGNWVTFFRERRLRHQLNLAASNGYGGRLQHRGEALLGRIGDFFSTYQPVPALLHGDLWGGNRAADERGEPVIFDPAVYYGDREADLAMTRLFGGFGADFYRAYETAWPLDAGAAVRTDLYNLYHVLNHLNLFGRGYLDQAVSLIDNLLAAV
ncbi:MAG: fructosamine kinase family protein [Steroidobacteraceae bacterium]